MADSQKPITLDDLSYKLRQVRYRRWLDKEDNVKRPTKLRQFNVNSPQAAVKYFNHYGCIGLDLNHRVLSEEENIGVLHDLANVPFDMVIDRMQREGIPVN